jgi:hypothetical protein
VGTGELNRILKDAMESRSPSSRGQRVKIHYATQTGRQPPTFVLFVNDKRLIGKDYLRYLTNRLRLELPFKEVPMRLVLRDGTEDEDEIAREERAQAGRPDLDDDETFGPADEGLGSREALAATADPIDLEDLPLVEVSGSDDDFDPDFDDEDDDPALDDTSDVVVHDEEPLSEDELADEHDDGEDDDLDDEDDGDDGDDGEDADGDAPSGAAHDPRRERS